MATRRMRIKAVINVPRVKSEPQDQPSPAPSAIATSTPETSVPLSPALVTSPRICSGRASPAPTNSTSSLLEQLPNVICSSSSSFLPRAETPPPPAKLEKLSYPSPTKSPSPAPQPWLQRPSPSISPACLPPSGTIFRRSPSPALSRLTNSPGPPSPGYPQPSSPVKSPVPSYASSVTSPHSPVKFFGRTPVMVTSSSGGKTCDSLSYPSSSSPNLPPVPCSTDKSQNSLFRPPPSPSPNVPDFHSVKSPLSGFNVSRPSPAQSPVFASTSRPPSNSSANFLSHHFNSNSNSCDSHEVAALMSGNSSNVPTTAFPILSGLFPSSSDKRPPSSSGIWKSGTHGSENLFPEQGSFRSISNLATPSPSFSKSILDNPEALRKRADENRKKEAQSNPTKFASARKEFLEKLQSGETPERNKMTMLHFTFYNPPDPSGVSKTPKKSRSRASSICSEVGNVINKRVDEPMNSDLEKSASAPSSIAGSRRTTASSVGSAGAASEAGSNTSSKSVPSANAQCGTESQDSQDDIGSCAASDAGSVASSASNGSVPGPRVKVGPDGQLIIDEKSLVVETSESQRARRQIEDMEVVSGADYAVGSSGFYRYKKYYRRGMDWTDRETVRFYRALNQCGTDFSMMRGLFPNRTRQELKAKFKREDRKNPDMISKALASCIFDPEEGISSDEDASAVNGKPNSKQPVEEEEVICSSEDPGGSKKKRVGKKKKAGTELTPEQVEDMQRNAPAVKGPGTGKGRKWNTPVEGLVKGKLPPKKQSESLPTVKIKVEKDQGESSGVEPAQPKKKVNRKKKTKDGQPQSRLSALPEGTVSIIIAPGAISTPWSDFQPVNMDIVKKEKPESKPVETNPSSSNKRRNRLPKPKPTLANVKLGGVTKKETASDSSLPVGESLSSSDNQSPNKGVRDDLFRFVGNDSLGMKTVPQPIPVLEERIVEGGEEDGEVIIMDLDKQSSLQAIASDTEQASTSEALARATSPKKRKRKLSTGNTDGIGVTTTRYVGWDPYAKTVMAMTSMAGTTRIAPSGSSVESGNKKLKVLPYRVPGPGGAGLSLPPRQTLPEELEIEIELNVRSSATES